MPLQVRFRYVGNLSEKWNLQEKSSLLKFLYIYGELGWSSFPLASWNAESKVMTSQKSFYLKLWVLFHCSGQLVR